MDKKVFETMSASDFYIGLGLVVTSSLFIGSSFIIKKKGLLRLIGTSSSLRAGAGGFGYLKEWIWWAGLITMGIGELMNFAAYIFAPASLVTPLGALSIIVTAILSSKFLDEHLNLIGKIGCVLCVIGSTIIVLHCPKEEEIESLSVLLEKLQEAQFLTYLIVIITISISIAFYFGPKYGKTSIVYYLLLCSAVGSLTVMSCKGLGLAIKETFSGNSNDLLNWLTYFFLASVIICIVVQTNYLNKALDLFNTGIVTSVYYVMFTSLVIIASSILFKEWNRLSLVDIISNICGFLILMIAIVLLNMCKNLDVNLDTVFEAKNENKSSKCEIFRNIRDDSLKAHKYGSYGEMLRTI